LTGARFSEIAVLRWRHWDKTFKPLTKITVAFSRDLKTGREKLTKTGTVREVPVHPVLQRVLERWQAHNWEAHYGRTPEDGDLIVPTYNLTARDVRNNWTRHKEDCDRIGIRMTRQHDARRTFISLSIAGGARSDILEWVTHAAQRKATINQYSTLPWATFCEAVQCLQIGFPEPDPCYPGATRLAEGAKNARCARKGS
jgi:integrase